MKRRKFVLGASASAFAGAASTAIPKPALAANQRELSMVTSWPKDFPGLGTSASSLGARITKLSGGTLKVNVYPRGSLVKSQDLYTAVGDGLVDMYHSIEHYQCMFVYGSVRIIEQMWYDGMMVMYETPALVCSVLYMFSTSASDGTTCCT